MNPLIRFHNIFLTLIKVIYKLNFENITNGAQKTDSYSLSIFHIGNVNEFCFLSNLVYQFFYISFLELNWIKEMLCYV